MMTKKNEGRIVGLLLVIWLLGMPVAYGWKVNAWRVGATSNFERENAALSAAFFSMLWPVLLPFSIADSMFEKNQLERNQ
jgi:hypothetical protein